MKIYRLNDYEWWLASSLQEAIEDRRRIIGNDEDVYEPAELTAVELDSLFFVDDSHDSQEPSQWRCACGAIARIDKNWLWNGERWQHSHPEQPAGVLPAANIHRRTFRQQLALELVKDSKNPRLFATTEY